MSRGNGAGRTCRAAVAAAGIALCAPAAWAYGPHGVVAFYPPDFADSPQAAHPQNQNRPQPSAPHSPVYGNPAPRPAYPGPPYLGPGDARPAYPGYMPPAELPSGPLGSWLNEHRGASPQEQERILRGDPSFQRLPAIDQQRLVAQLHQVNRMTEEQRQRRLARAQMLESLSPQERMRVNLSARRWAALPMDRQTLMKRAFRDLRAVPLDQRQVVLNSNRYQGVFSPEERGILADMLRVEPCQPAR